MTAAGRISGEAARRFELTVLLAVGVGAVTGLGVVAFRFLVEQALDVVRDAPTVAVAVLPGLGLVVTQLVLHLSRGGDRATTDAYVRAYHERDGLMGPTEMGRKLAAALASIGSGHALGLEGPSMVIGGSVGSTTERRLAARIGRDDAKVLMVAGAAAGVAAVFKAPLTGVIFALEVPYRADLARRALLPSLVAAASSYVVFAAIVGTTPLLPTAGSPPFDLVDLGGGAVLGLICGVLARLGAWSIGRAKQVRARMRWRIVTAAVVYAVLAPLAVAWFDAPVHLGPGYEAIEWAIDPDRSLWLLAALFAVRAVATCASIGGGGVGGLFIPLVTQGAIAGACFQQLVDAPSRNLFAAIGIAALLGAGYRTPLAGVAFVAEATAQPGYLVPALLAAATAQLAMGRRSFSPYQRLERTADVRPLNRLRVGEIMYPADADARPELAPGPTVRRDDSVATAVDAVRRHGLDALAVVDDDGAVVGSVTAADLDQLALLVDHLVDG